MRAPALPFYPINRRRGKAVVGISREEWLGVEPLHETLARNVGVSYQNQRAVNERTSRNGGIIRTVPNGGAEFFFRREATAAAAAATAFDSAKTAATSAEFLAESSILPSWPTAKQSRISRLQPLSLFSVLFYVTMLPIYCAIGLEISPFPRSNARELHRYLDLGILDIDNIRNLRIYFHDAIKLKFHLHFRERKRAIIG